MALIKERTRRLNRSKTLSLAILKRQSKARHEQIKRQLTELEDALLDLVRQCPKRARAFDILCSIPGLGRITTVAILFECPAIGTLTRKQIASLAGLAPMTRQSAHWRGKAVIQGGRKILRDALYMPALVAARYNPDLRQKYQALDIERKTPKNRALQNSAAFPLGFSAQRFVDSRNEAPTSLRDQTAADRRRMLRRA